MNAHVVHVLAGLQNSKLVGDMPSFPHHWFVQTDFGAVLGPMPVDALAEMARTGALLVRDQVREGTGGVWRRASEVPGLFDEQTPSLGLRFSTLEDLFVPETSAPHESAASRNVDRRSLAKLEETPLASESQAREFEIDIPLIAPPPTIPTRLESELVNDLVPPAEPPNIRELQPILPAPLGWQARVAPASRWKPAATRSLRSWQFDKPAALKGAIAVVVLVVLVGAWWFWPRQRPDIYKNYVAIYQELQQRRDLAKDHATWTEFVTRAKTQLAATVPWLEENAKPGDREKSLLLYAGRDLQELLELPRTSKSPQQTRLNAFFEQLHEFYGSN